jgi:hypothetical protein
MSSATRPRDIALRVRITLHLRSVLCIIGASFLVAGLLAMAFADHLANFRQTIQFRDTDPSTIGILISKQKSTARSGGRRNGFVVYEHTYFYQVGSTNYEGVSYARDEGLTSGNPVEVAYVPGNPGSSRIKGMGAGVFVRVGMWFAFAANIMLVVGLAFLVAGLKKVGNTIHLARNGVRTTAKVTHKTATNTQINGKQEYDIHFGFTLADGSSCTTSIRAHQIEALLDDHHEPILYDANNPAHAVMVDALPQELRTLVI